MAATGEKEELRAALAEARDATAVTSSKFPLRIFLLFKCSFVKCSVVQVFCCSSVLFFSVLLFSVLLFKYFAVQVLCCSVF
jgi:hypothetical protein